MKDFKPNTNELCIEDSKTWTKTWQVDQPDMAKAFLIPVIDLIALLEEMKVLKKQKNGDYSLNDLNNDVRAYLGIKDNPDIEVNEKLLLVGTKKDDDRIPRDIVKGGAFEPASGDSGVYDFTHPCPTMCDTKSPLFHKK